MGFSQRLLVLMMGNANVNNMLSELWLFFQFKISGLSCMYSNILSFSFFSSQHSDNGYLDIGNTVIGPDHVTQLVVPSSQYVKVVGSNSSQVTY